MKRPILLAGVALLMLAIPVSAQDANVEGRVTKLEKEMKAVQRKVFPEGAGKFFEPEIKPETPVNSTSKLPSGTEVTDLIGRVDALETQLAALTGQVEQQGNSMKAMEARLKALEAEVKALAATPVAAVAEPKQADPPLATPAKTATVPPAKPVAAPQGNKDKARQTAVAKIERPSTGNAFDDSYSYGYRLWEAKFYPEAQAQLEETIKKFPGHSGLSRARNLLGRAWLDDGRPSQAAKIFYENYKTDEKGERAPESLYFLGEAFIAMDKPADACGVFAQLVKAFPGESAGRLATRLATARKKAKCS